MSQSYPSRPQSRRLVRDLKGDSERPPKGQHQSHDYSQQHSGLSRSDTEVWACFHMGIDGLGNEVLARAAKKRRSDIEAQGCHKNEANSGRDAWHRQGPEYIPE